MNNNGLHGVFLQRPALSLLLKPWQKIVTLFLFLILIPFPLFYGLDTLVVREYDEARRAVNAYEMMHDGNLLVTHFQGSPDMWGTKPPLLVWGQTFLMKILGPGEWAVRLPSALAGLFTCLAIFGFASYFLKNSFFGLIWALVLVTANGYVDMHGTRTGDYDALLTFFMTLYSLSFFIFILDCKPKYLYLTFIFISLAVLTKGIAGMLFLPALFLFAWINKSLKMIFSTRHFYWGAMIFIGLVAGYYVGREFDNPGYLRAVWANELGGRYGQSLEGHDQPFWYHLQLLIYPRLDKWIAFVIPGLIAGFLIKDKFLVKLNLLSFFILVTHFLIISLSRTKLPWYDLPEFPFLALSVANFTWFFFAWLKHITHYLKVPVFSVIPLIFLVLIFYEPCRLTLKEVMREKEQPWALPAHEFLYVLRDGVEGRRNLDGYSIVHEGYDAHLQFYLYLLKDKEQNLIRKDKDELKAGERVIAHQDEVKKYIKEHYPAEVIETMDYISIFAIR
jgi:4-amino-4-deoxy-L-arabinose transferase-like glycosyltransferase